MAEEVKESVSSPMKIKGEGDRSGEKQEEKVDTQNHEGSAKSDTEKTVSITNHVNEVNGDTAETATDGKSSDIEDPKNSGEGKPKDLEEKKAKVDEEKPTVEEEKPKVEEEKPKEEEVKPKEEEVKPKEEEEKPKDVVEEKPMEVEEQEPKDLTEEKPMEVEEETPKILEEEKPKDLAEGKPKNTEQEKSKESEEDKPKNTAEEKSKGSEKEKPKESEGEEPKEAEEEKPVDPHQELASIISDGTNSLYVKKDAAEAAESLGLACEKARELYGEMGDECAEIFFLYGCAMLECSKILENTVFGEKGPKEEESDDEEEEDGEEEEEDEPVMLTKKTSEALRKMEEEKASEEEKVGEETTEENEEEDNMLRAAWEMFELSKVIFQRQEKEDKVAEIYMKLGEVSVESGNIAAVDDMKEALAIRKRIYPEGDRIIPETHFHIGLAYALFEMFDEAIEHFKTSKNLLNDRIASLKKLETEKSANEVKEIEDLLPEIDEKISDMVGSKEEKLKAEELKKNGEGSSASPEKKATNITHLVKRKRKLDDTVTDLNSAPTKQICLGKNGAEK